MLINGHAHVFNLQSVLTDHSLDILRKRLQEELQPKVLGEAVGDVIADLFGKVQQGNTIDEGKLVHEVLGKLTGNVDFEDLRNKLPAVARQILDRGLDKLADALLFRLIDGLDRALNRRQGDVRSANVTDAIALLRLALQAKTRDVAARLMHQLGPDRGVVALMMDITNGDGGDNQLFAAQTRDLSDLILAYPGRIFPFFAVHTRRPDHLSRLRTALTEQGFVGVKLYPALGSEVTSEAMKTVLRTAADLDAPILSHTTPSGFFETDATLDFGDPVHWGPLFEEIAGFRICFAHFGGSSNLAQQPIPGLDQANERRRWTARILQMMHSAHGDRVFADVSYHESPMESEANEIKYFENLKAFLADATLRDRVLFGTDSWVMRTRCSEGSYWRFFQDGLDTEGLTEAEFRRLSETNNHRFLGLPLASRGLPMGSNIQRYVAFVNEHKDKLTAKPAPWLLEALGTDATQELEAREWPLADSFQAPDWKDLLETVVQDVLDTTVSGATGNSVQIADASFSFDASPLSFQGDGQLSLAVFNRTDQFRSSEKADPDGVIGPATDDDRDPFAPFRQPTVSFDPAKAWLKYRSEGHLALTAQTDVGLAAVGLEASAEKTVVLADYRRHERVARLRDLVPDDLRWPRFALDVEDVLRLDVGDAVSFQTHGRLTARLSASLSDAFTFGLSRVARSLDVDDPLSLEVKAGLRVSAEVSVEDDFSVIFARRGGGRLGWRAQVRKIETRGRGFNAAVGAEVVFKDPEAASRAVASLVDQKLGEPLDQVQALLRQANLDDLGPEQRKQLDRVAEKLGASSLTDLEEKVNELPEEIKKLLDEVVRERLSLGFAYEYSRIETDTALLVADLEARAVAALHGQMVRGNFEPAIEWADHRDPEVARAVKIVRYVLTEEKVSRSRWGFSLRFGRWLDLAQQDERELVQRRQRSRLSNDETAERLTYLGSRSRSERWMGREWDWQVDLDARMERVSAHAEPNTSDFTYNLGFDFHWKTRKLKQVLLDQILDAAALWGILPGDLGTADALRESFEQSLKRRHQRTLGSLMDKKVECHLQLLFDQVALSRILPRAKRDDAESRDRMAAALAAAMPFRTSTPHDNLRVRREAYTRLFRTYLEEAPSRVELRLSDYKDDARKEMKRLRHDVQARREDDGQTLERVWTFAGMLSKNPKTVQQWASCRQGLDELAKGVGRVSGTKHTMVKAMFKDMARFWGQTHHVRAYGAYMLDVARAQEMPKGVAPGLRIEVEDKFEISFGAPAP